MQRNHQKLIEESPSPAVTDEMRAEMNKYAILAAKTVGYTNAGTIEFIVDSNGHFYFMEMNTRIQVEHGVTEMVTGTDLIIEQIRVAMGEPLSFTQEDVRPRGHAIECRINAEIPEKNFMPSPGVVRHLHLPAGNGVRVDTGLYTGYKIPSEYDSMIAKVIVHAPTREAALMKMRSALNEMLVIGVETNLDFQYQIMAHPGYPDLMGFGRRNMNVSPAEAKAYTLYQIGALDAFCKASDVEMQHVKPHGAFYNMAAKDYKLAKGICEAIAEYNPKLILMALAGSEMIRAGQDCGLRTASEVFADRAYEEDGTLVARTKEGAMITDENEAIARVIRMVKEQKVQAITGAEDVHQKLADHKIDGFVLNESPQWEEDNISAITRIGASCNYFVISRNRPDLKADLDIAMQKIAHDFCTMFPAKYFTNRNAYNIMAK